MKFYQQWTGCRLPVAGEQETFPATVPGNIQQDYARAAGFPDVMMDTNVRMFEALENDTWEYCARLCYEKKAGERVWFVSKGIDYRFEIFLNRVSLLTQEGMFRPVELELTEKLTGEDTLTVRVYPHPKRPGAAPGTRDEADASCKSAVSYGWDWNPRLLISGMWQEAYIETRDDYYISECEPVYTLAEDFSEAKLRLDYCCDRPCRITVMDREGQILYNGADQEITWKDPHLWWCNGQGEAYLYRYRVENDGYLREGTFGLRRVRLLRNADADEKDFFPKPRYDAPITLELNGRRIFMKGTNYVNPDIFWGQIDERTYREQLELVRDANMNIVRLWGGAAFCKEPFYRLCDEMGILVWQEFMLACNAYPNDANYLRVLEAEASHMIRQLRSHPCIAFWCGGNELYNSWSGMHDQSLPLRLLDKLCYELDREKPFLRTSPLTGMGHGCYVFYEPKRMGGDAFQCFQNASCTAYTEFGVPSISSRKQLEKIIPADQLEEISDTPAWRMHHAIGAWLPQSHACLEILEHYFGKDADLDTRIAQSDWLQSEGSRAMYEEARRQAPHCSGALNWCFNEPWITAANCSIVSYPAQPKPAYFAVREALRSVCASARIPKFDWVSGEEFTAQLWLLNDSGETVTREVKAALEIGGVEYPLISQTITAQPRCNAQGVQVYLRLPRVAATQMVLHLDTGDDARSSYRLCYRQLPERSAPKAMNL